MNSSLPRILFCLAISLVTVDIVWGFVGHFSIDVAAYARLALIGAGLFAGGLFYQTKRPEPSLAVMLMGASFLCVFSASASMLNYFLLTVAGPRIDDALIRVDHLLGFDWVTAMTFMSEHTLLNTAFYFVYSMTLPQIAILIVVLAWNGKCLEVYRFCTAVAVGALIAIFVWASMPSLGAKSVYALPPGVESKMLLMVTMDYGRALVDLLHNGPGYITPQDIRGLIAFPSYHAVLALLVVWYARSITWLRWPALVLNMLVLVSAPIQGGHHMIDIFGGFPVTILAILSVRWLESVPSFAIFAPALAAPRESNESPVNPTA